MNGGLAMERKTVFMCSKQLFSIGASTANTTCPVKSKNRNLKIN